MKNRSYQYLLMAVIFGALALQGCTTVPLTGRKQLTMYPESEMINMSLTQYDEFMKASKLSTNAKQTAMVKNIGQKMAVAVEAFLTEKKLQSRIEGFKWEFNLVEDEKTPNAWCMPGGKVVVYSGLLPYTQTEDGLAVVMGHEIAHAVARHGNERMSQQMGIQLGGMALSTAVSEKPEQTQQIYMSAFGLGSQLGVMLPYSRSHETEADKMGLIFMAMAGYDPNAAIAFWERMAQTGGKKPPEFMSTHPSDQTRVNELKTYMPEALKYYKKQ